MTQPIRVLLVEDNRIEAHQTKKWLSGPLGEVFRLEWVEQLNQASARLAQGGIDVALLDLNLPDSEGLETFLKLHVQAPNLPIVVLTGQDDEALGALAVEKGAQDYLVKQQVDGKRLAQVLRFARARHRALEDRISNLLPGKSARIVGFQGAKGGVGTTTVALNVASSLARQGKSVILAELHPAFGTLAYLTGNEPRAGLRTLLNDFPDRLSEQDVQVLLCHGPHGMRILFGPQQGDLFQEIDPQRAESIVKTLAAMTEFVILDLPTQPSAATHSVARLCHFIAVVTNRELGSVICGKVALNQLRSWGIDSQLAGAVVARRGESFAPAKAAEIRAQLGCACFETMDDDANEQRTATDEVATGCRQTAGAETAGDFVGAAF